MGGANTDPQECSEAQVKAMLARSPFGAKFKRWLSCGKGTIGAVSPAHAREPWYCPSASRARATRMLT